MAEVLDSYDFSAGSAGRYNWDEILDGQIRKMIGGEDFTVKTTSFITSAKKAAQKRGKNLNVRTDGSDVVLQATS
jgi:hypothetical protein